MNNNEYNDNIVLTAKLQIYVPPEKHSYLTDTMKAYKNACNYISEYVFHTDVMNRNTLQKIHYDTLRSKFGLRSQMAISVIRTVVSEYKAMQENNMEKSLIVFKRPQYSLVWNRDYSLSANTFSVNTLYGRIKVPYAHKGMEKYFDHDKYKFGTAQLVYKHSKFYLYISITGLIEDLWPEHMNYVVGIDRGIRNIITTYDGTHSTRYVKGGYVRHRKNHFKEVAASLQKKGTPSARKRLKAIGNRENRWMNDLTHQISKTLVKTYPEKTLFVVENLKGLADKSSTGNRNYNAKNNTYSTYNSIERKLVYKARIKNSIVLKVDPRFTSQRCPVCNHTEKENRNHHMHTFKCKKCGYCSNDDRIGAMNLYRNGIYYMYSCGKVQGTIAIK